MRVIVPEAVQLRRTVPHQEVRAARAVPTVDGTRQVHHVLAFHRHVLALMVNPDCQANFRSSREEATLHGLFPAHARLLAAVHAPVMRPDPVWLCRRDVARAVRLQIGHAAVFHESQLAGLHQPVDRVDEGQEREVGVMLEERVRDLRDGGQEGLPEILALKPPVELQVVQALRLRYPGIVRLAAAQLLKRLLEGLGQLVAGLDDPLSGLAVQLVQLAREHQEGVLHEPLKLFLLSIRLTRRDRLGRHHPPPNTWVPPCRFVPESPNGCADNRLIIAKKWSFVKVKSP